MIIVENYCSIRASLPDYVTLVIAAKTRTKEEIEEVIAAGATDLGYNQVQEAERMHHLLGNKATKVRWHMIGTLQKNKVNRALAVFDVIQTIDSYELAEAINKRSFNLTPVRIIPPVKIIPVYIEVKISEEESKHGVKPENIRQLLSKLSSFSNIKIEGLMAMEPYLENPELAQPYFRRMRQLFDELRQIKQPNLDLKVLSLGMSAAYKAAVEEGSTMVRIGTAVFGERKYY